MQANSINPNDVIAQAKTLIEDDPMKELAKAYLLLCDEYFKLALWTFFYMGCLDIYLNNREK